MKKPLDRITEAYKGNLGEDFGKKTRNRINWIVNHVKGNKILDIGCSQGIVPIILGREGKEVDALDIAQESIEYAKEQLENEHKSVQNNVKFKISNFMVDTDIDNDYETVILSEVLEHIADPERFLKKIHNHLKNEGYLIVTVPFGINDYFDHKRTYYFLELNDHLSTYFSIEKINYLGKWTGVICRKNIDNISTPKKIQFSRENLKTLEQAFYNVERELFTKIENLQLNIKEKNDQTKKIEKQNSHSTEKLKEQILERDKKIDELITQNNKKIEEIKEEKQINRLLLQQIKEQNTEFKVLLQNIKKEHQHCVSNFEKQFEQKKEESKDLKSVFSNVVDELNKTNEENKIFLNDILQLVNEKQISILESHNSEINNQNNKIDNLTKIIEDYQVKELEIIEKIEFLKSQLIQRNQDQNSNQINELKAEFLKSLDLEENALNLVIEEREKNYKYEQYISVLEDRINILDRKYTALKNSKLGNLTLRYWRFKNKSFK